jgi:hypothetical protein
LMASWGASARLHRSAELQQRRAVAVSATCSARQSR